MHHQAQPKEFITVPCRSALPPPKFSLGDRVCWHRVPSCDFGVVRDRFYGTEGSVQATGWHYLVELAPQSPSFSHCKEDYGFEEDLEFVDQGQIE